MLLDAIHLVLYPGSCGGAAGQREEEEEGWERKRQAPLQVGSGWLVVVWSHGRAATQHPLVGERRHLMHGVTGLAMSCGVGRWVWGFPLLYLLLYQ